MRHIRKVIFIAFGALLVGNLNTCAQGNICPTTYSYTYGNFYDSNDAVDFFTDGSSNLISIDFTSGFAEQNYDIWYVTDGAGGTGNIIYSGTGYVSTTTTWTSTTGVISFYVWADGSNTGSTFNF